MAYGDHYLALTRNARDALRAWLDETPSDGLSVVWSVCNGLDEALRQESEARWEEYHERRRVWRQTPKDRRETLVLQALGSEQLTIREVMAGVNFELGATDDGSCFVYEGDVRRVMMRMLDGGQLERAKEVFRNKPRFHYFRTTRLDGPIAELEQAYHDEAVS